VTSLDNFPIQWADPLAVVTLPDEIDISNADQIRDTLLAVLNRDVTTLVVDMTRTTFCGCAGASAVARAHQRATANQAQVRVAITVPVVRRVFAITGVDRLVSIFDSVSAAMAGLAATPALAALAADGTGPSELAVLGGGAG